MVLEDNLVQKWQVTSETLADIINGLQQSTAPKMWPLDLLSVYLLSRYLTSTYYMPGRVLQAATSVTQSSLAYESRALWFGPSSSILQLGKLRPMEESGLAF